MGKANIKAGAKLDLAARVGEGEREYKSSLVKERGGEWLVTMPMLNGETVVPEKGTQVAISWAVDNGLYTLQSRVKGTTKQGVRTYLVLSVEEEVQRTERRIFQRVAAEVEVELESFNTDLGGVRSVQLHKGRTTDISNGGTAVVTSAALAVGEVIKCTIARRGVKKLPLRAEVCWIRPAPRGTGYRDAVGLRFLFASSDEGIELAKMTASLAAKQ